MTANDANAGVERDSRDIITPHNFRVASHLVGLPLASPWRRLAAIALDGLLLAILVDGGMIAVILMAVVFAVGWLRRRSKEGAARSTSRVSAGTLLTVFALIAAVAVGNQVFTGDDEDDDDAPSHELHMEPGQAVAFGVALAQLKTCGTAACRATAVDATTNTLVEAKSHREDALAAVDGVLEGMELPEDEAHALHDRAVSALKGLPSKDAPAAATGEAEAKAAGIGSDDADEPESKPGKKKRWLSKDGGFSLLATVRNVVDDLGISAGWAALYFTLFTWLWNGQTPAKRLLGLRVVNLRGHPLTWWDGFERFGGYAAGVATGLMGFAQVFWDANRQAIHDRVSFTAVIRDPDGKALERAQELRLSPPPTAA